MVKRGIEAYSPNVYIVMEDIYEYSSTVGVQCTITILIDNLIVQVQWHSYDVRISKIEKGLSNVEFEIQYENL